MFLVNLILFIKINFNILNSIRKSVAYLIFLKTHVFLTTVKYKTPIDLKTLVQPHKVPEHLLPFLAWSVATDNWQDNLTFNQKQNLVASSIDVHRKKGTRGAMNSALKALDFSVDFKEWFNAKPINAPFTFNIQINIDDKPLPLKKYNQILKTIASAKNSRSHLSKISVFSKTSASFIYGAFIKTGAITYIGEK